MTPRTGGATGWCRGGDGKRRAPSMIREGSFGRALRALGALRARWALRGSADVAVDVVLVELLLAALERGLAALVSELCQLRQGQLASLEIGASAAVEGGVALLAHLLDRRLLDDVVSDDERARERVHAADV